MSSQEIVELEQQIAQLTARLNRLRKEAAPKPAPVPDYRFQTLSGEVTLLDLFGDRQRLLTIHNMGQGCRYCTLWADSFNGLLAHLESVMSVVLLSRDPPPLQRDFASSRHWRFRLASHGGGDYIREQTVMEGADNIPGAVVYERSGNDVFRRSSAVFGPGDLYCSMWNLLALAGIGTDEWTPQYRYWTRSVQMDDGGENLLE